MRPLLYGWTPNYKLVISSEAKCLSMCKTIYHVLPGSMMVFDILSNHILYKEMYYDISRLSFTKSLYSYQNINMLKPLLEQAVKLRLLSDRPIGCLLSGGLDSSIITSILCRYLDPKDVRTYSIGMEGSIDLFYARKVADYLGTTHTEVKFTPEEGFRVIPEVIKVLESFDITTVRASVGMYLLGKYIKENTKDKVIFSGEGSDELLCGYVYFHNAPNGETAHDESIRLISEMYKYDCLRADRCISSNGLELRVPFLDKNVLEFCTTLSGDIKKPSNGIEKKILRDLFKGSLPHEIICRRKDGFSDGVSSLSKSWYEYIQEFVETEVSDEEFSTQKCQEFEFAISKEAYYYKKIYDSHFPFYPNPIDKYWMPKWSSNTNNPSGRILKAF